MNEMERTVCAVLQEYTGAPVDPADTMDNLEIDSLDLIQVGLDLEEHYGNAASVGVDDVSTLLTGTVADFVKLIQSRL